MFSVIVPIYKVEDYIRPCIDSIIKQSYTNFELILVDDGSPDNCGVICDEYSKRDSRIKVIHKKNGGLVSARKAGLSAARGDYIFNVDGDDFIAENLFQEIADIVKECDPGIVVFNSVRIVSDMKIFEPKYIKCGLHAGNQLDAIKEVLIYHAKVRPFRGIIYPGIVFKAIKREILMKYQLRVPNRIKIGEDFAITIPAILDAEKVYFSNIDGYYYRYNKNSMTCSFDKNVMKDIRNLIDFLDTVVNYDKYDTRNQMAAYIINRLFNALVLACRSITTYAEYKKIVREIDDFLFHRIQCYKYSFHDLKSSAISFALQHHLWWLFWMFYHNKKQS